LGRICVGRRAIIGHRHDSVAVDAAGGARELDPVGIEPYAQLPGDHLGQLDQEAGLGRIAAR